MLLLQDKVGSQLQGKVMDRLLLVELFLHQLLLLPHLLLPLLGHLITRALHTRQIDFSRLNWF